MSIILYKGRVSLKCCNVVVHVIHTTIMILRPFGSGSKAEVSKYLNGDIGKEITCTEL